MAESNPRDAEEVIDIVIGKFLRQFHHRERRKIEICIQEREREKEEESN